MPYEIPEDNPERENGKLGPWDFSDGRDNAQFRGLAGRYGITPEKRKQALDAVMWAMKDAIDKQDQRGVTQCVKTFAFLDMMQQKDEHMMASMASNLIDTSGIEVRIIRGERKGLNGQVANGDD